MRNEEEVSAYERLRQEALGASGEEGGHGRALLVGRGMAAWLRAFASYPGVASDRARRKEPWSVEESASMNAEITQILTNMVFAVLR